MTKRWSFLAILLIVIGIIGMAINHFKFEEPLQAYQQRWDISQIPAAVLEIDTGYSTDVEFISSGTESGYVELDGKLKQALIDRLKDTKPTGEGLALDLTDDSFQFLTIQFKSPKLHIKVALPEATELNRFHAQGHSSHIRVNGLKAAEADVKTNSGNLSVSNAAASQLTLSASSGNVTARNIQSPLVVNVHSGNIKLHEITGSGSYTAGSGNITGEQINGQTEIKDSSGNVSLKSFTGAGKIEANSGNVTLSNQRSDQLDISVKSGNVKLSLDDAFQGFYDLQASSGTVHAPNASQQTNDVIKVRTKSGNITIK